MKHKTCQASERIPLVGRLVKDKAFYAWYSAVSTAPLPVMPSASNAQLLLCIGAVLQSCTLQRDHSQVLTTHLQQCMHLDAAPTFVLAIASQLPSSYCRKARGVGKSI